MSLSRNTASYFPRPRLRSQTTMSMTAPTIRVAGHHDACRAWARPNIQLRVSFIVSLHHGLEEERLMTVEKKRSGLERRSRSTSMPLGSCEASLDALDAVLGGILSY